MTRNLEENELPRTLIVSYPKSGRTWLQFKVANVVHELSGISLRTLLSQDQDGYRDHRSRPLPKFSFGHGYRYGSFCRGGVFPVEHYEGARVIILVRDPRDTLVSGFYYQKYQFCRFDGSLHDYLHFPENAHQVHLGKAGSRARHFPFGLWPILRYHQAWENHLSRLEEYMIVSYEELHADSQACLERVLKFIGIRASAQQLANAVESASFERMRSSEIQNNLGWNALPGAQDPRGLKTRRGQIGDFRTEFSSSDLDFLDKVLAVESPDMLRRYTRPC